jgi:hypothetical protein
VAAVAAVVAMRWVADENARPGAHLAKFCWGQPLRRPVIVHADLVRCLSVALLTHSPRGAMLCGWLARTAGNT